MPPVRSQPTRSGSSPSLAAGGVTQRHARRGEIMNAQPTCIMNPAPAPCGNANDSHPSAFAAPDLGLLPDFAPIEPWPEAVPGDRHLDALLTLLSHFVVFRFVIRHSSFVIPDKLSPCNLWNKTLSPVDFNTPQHYSTLLPTLIVPSPRRAIRFSAVIQPATGQWTGRQFSAVVPLRLPAARSRHNLGP